MVQGLEPWNKGRSMSMETRLKMSAAKMGCSLPKAVCTKISQARTGKVHSEVSLMTRNTEHAYQTSMHVMHSGKCMDAKCTVGRILDVDYQEWCTKLIKSTWCAISQDVACMLLAAHSPFSSLFRSNANEGAREQESASDQRNIRMMKVCQI